MDSITARAARIILVFRCVFLRRLLAVAGLALLATSAAQAQSALRVKLSLEYKGGLYTVQPSALSTGDRAELPVDPRGVIKVFARAISLPGVSGQALVDLQIYESRGGAQSQVAALTMPVYFDTNNVSDVASRSGNLKITAYVTDGSQPARTARPQAVPAPINVPPNASQVPEQNLPRRPLPPVSPGENLPEPQYLQNPGGAVPVPVPVPAPVPVPVPGQQSRARVRVPRPAQAPAQVAVQPAPFPQVSGAYSPAPPRRAAAPRQGFVGRWLFPNGNDGMCHDLSNPQG